MRKVFLLYYCLTMFALCDTFAQNVVGGVSPSPLPDAVTVSDSSGLLRNAGLDHTKNGSPEMVKLPTLDGDDSKATYGEVVHDVNSSEPKFPGGMDSLYAFLYRNLVYPKKAKEKGIEGIVYVSFVVGKDGSISKVKVVRDIGGGCGAEAVRVVRMMPKWTPCKVDGKVLRATNYLPIQFSLR